MAKIQKFQDLIVWQKAHELTLLTYKLTNQWPGEEKFGLISQARRSSASVPANIVEGFRRQTVKDSLSFYNRAAASLDELEYHLLLAKDLSYMAKDLHAKSQSLVTEVSKLLFAWMQSQRKYSS